MEASGEVSRSPHASHGRYAVILLSAAGRRTSVNFGPRRFTNTARRE